MEYNAKYKTQRGSICNGFKLTQAQLQIVVKAHEEKKLICGGSTYFKADGIGCINQHLFNDGSILASFERNPAVGAWFDDHYPGARHYPSGRDVTEHMTSQGLVDGLKEAGLVEND